MEALLQGVVIGLGVAAPPGANAALCMSRTLSGGRGAGLRCGMGAASAHALYATLALVGADRASTLLVKETNVIRVAGGLVLVGLGLRLARRRSEKGAPSNARAYSVTLALGLVNPLTLLYFSAAMALGTIPSHGGTMVVAGVFTGSVVWWAILTNAVAALGRHLDERRLGLANRLVALSLAGCGLVAVATAL